MSKSHLKVVYFQRTGRTDLNTRILSPVRTLSSIRWKSRTILAEFSSTPVLYLDMMSLA